MAGAESARVASAYLEIKARDAGVHGDVERIGKSYGARAGAAASEEFNRKFDRGLRDGEGKHIAEGRKIGEEIGDAAGKEAGDRTSKGIGDSVIRSRAKRRKDGEAVGKDIADGAAKSFKTRFLAGLKGTGTNAGKVLKNDFYQAINSGTIGAIKASATIIGLAKAATLLGTLANGAVGSVISLSGAIGVLPAIGVSAGIAMAALKIGVMGVSAALSDNADPKKYADDLKKLAPPAADFVKAIVRMKPALVDVKKSVQGGLFKGLDKEVTALGSRYLPILKSGLTGVAGSFNVAALSVGRFLDKSTTASKVSGIFSNIRTAASDLTGAVKPAVAAILDIVSTGANFLPQFATGITNASQRFAGFIAQTAKTGQLRSFFRDGISAVGDLGGVLKGLGRIIGNIFQAGNGATTSPLATLSILINRIADTVGSPAIQAGLTRFFDSIAQTGSQLGDKVQQLGEALVTLEPTISTLVRGAGAALPSILTSAAAAATALAPALEFVSGILEKIAPHAGGLVLALIGVKVALLGLRTAAGVVETLALIGTQMDAVGLSAVRSRIALLGFGGALRLAVKGGVLFASAFVLAKVFGSFVTGADASKAKVTDLTVALKRLQETGRGSQEISKTYKDLGAELQKSLDPSVGRKFEDSLGKVQSKLTSLLTAGKSDGSGKGGFFSFNTGVSSEGGKQATALAAKLKETDAALTGLVTSGKGEQAAALFATLQKASVAGGAGVGDLASRLPGFTSALGASGATINATTGKVDGLRKSLADLSRETNEYADRALAGRATARGYAAALDQAKEAAKANGKTLNLNTAAGRANSQALDDLAQAGLNLASTITGTGVISEAKFRNALLETRGDLITAGERFGLTAKQAKAYADSILKIPKSAHTDIFARGTSKAIRELTLLKLRADQLDGKTVTITQRTYYERFGLSTSPGAVDRQTGKAAGGFVQPIRRAPGGLVDWRLGGPRQDNVPLLVSGREFVVNAYATAQPGALAFLRQLNGENRMPKLATGGQVTRASAGMNDLSAGKAARIDRIAAAGTPQAVAQVETRMHRDDLDYIVRGFAAALRNQPVIIDADAIAGAVYKAGGRY